MIIGINVYLYKFLSNFFSKYLKLIKNNKLFEVKFIYHLINLWGNTVMEFENKSGLITLIYLLWLLQLH